MLVRSAGSAGHQTGQRARHSPAPAPIDRRATDRRVRPQRRHRWQTNDMASFRQPPASEHVREIIRAAIVWGYPLRMLTDRRSRTLVSLTLTAWMCSPSAEAAIEDGG